MGRRDGVSGFRKIRTRGERLKARKLAIRAAAKGRPPRAVTRPETEQ